MTLATANKQFIVDNIIAKEIEANKLQDDKKDARSEELMSKSMKDLNQLMKDLETVKDDNTQRTPATVPNPTLANPDDNTTDSNGSADTNSNKNTGNTQTAKKTVEDFANDIIKKLVK